MFVEIQLTLEQHGFELCRCIYTWIFFFSPNTTVLQHPQLVESEDVESREGGTKDKEG